MELVLIKSFTNKPWRNYETYELIEKCLSQKWSVKSIATDNPEELHQYLINQRQWSEDKIFVFNIAEYLDETNKLGFIPGLLDAWKIPHLGSKAETIALGLDKAKTKNLLIKKNIPTPKFFIADKMDLDYSSYAEEIKYPLFVKPLYEGGHIGIGDHSIVYNSSSLNNEITNIIHHYQQPALVEKFIGETNMREFSVGIVCGEPTLFTPVEIDYEKMQVDNKILSYESAENDLERIKLVNDKAISESLINLTQKTFDAIGASDYSRVDIRMDSTGFYILEINVMPGLGPHSFLPEAAESLHGIRYEQLIQRLVDHSLKRQDLG